MGAIVGILTCKSHEGWNTGQPAAHCTNLLDSSNHIYIYVIYDNWKYTLPSCFSAFHNRLNPLFHFFVVTTPSLVCWGCEASLMHKYQKRGSLYRSKSLDCLSFFWWQSNAISDVDLARGRSVVSQAVSIHAPANGVSLVRRPGLFFLRATFIVGNPLPAHKGQTVESALTLSPVSSGRLRFPYCYCRPT